MTETRIARIFQEMPLPIKELVIAIKGAGEMATGIACRLFQANFKHIFMVEIENPMAVRRRVSFCEAIHDGTIEVEGVRATRVLDMNEIPRVWENHCIPVLVDPDWRSIKTIRPQVVVDAIIAKKNLGTRKAEAPLVIGLGPGFEAGLDVHRVIETLRGHNLGRIIDKGCPAPNTGIPGPIGGYTSERVLRAPCLGTFTAVIPIGAMVKKNEIIGHVGNQPVIATIDGILRGLIRDNTRVKAGLKIGDIDPRGNREYLTSISEKARAIGGGVLEAILREYNH
ncbi:MAG: EF2563 family selenium-dependent molybdenum hydroxylase system protein [Proteobacteria bacterium]|nr:EF2563 family selenium-dependent molybdenum hydroxylase system protein [Pseudomonadota bacterium]